jgi:hypothetical protein
MYLSLDASKIVDTCRALHEQVGNRFPGSGLSHIAGELHSVSTHAAEMSEWLARPQMWLRALAAAGIGAIVFVVIGVIVSVDAEPRFTSFADFLQASEAAINEVVFLGIAIFFFITLEGRLKRRRALKAIHVLRSLAHIIDMHQLTKDPERILSTPSAGSGPRRPQNPAELIRYLDACSDLLALISKIAALYVQNFDDPVTLAAVNEVEALTNGLSRTIWQKIMILDRILAGSMKAAAAAEVTKGETSNPA